MKLLVSDYDGTFYTDVNDDKHIRINVDKITEFVDNGNVFMLSSGRSYNSLMGRVNAHKIPVSYIATEDGSHLFDKDGNVLFERFLDTRIIGEIDGLLKFSRHRQIQFGTTREYFYDELPDIPVSSINLVLYEDNITRPFEEEWNRLKEANKDNNEFLKYGYNNIYYYCIKPKGIDKSRPVSELSKLIHVPKKDIFTIGDGDNDIPMVKKYNGFMIGDSEDLEKVSLKKYKKLHELIDDIDKQKVLRRW